MIDAGLGGTEPFHGVAAGQYVLLDAEGGNVEAVDHVLRSHDQFDVAPHWNVQFVDLALTFGVFPLPHPLLGYDVHFGCTRGRDALSEVDGRAPGENYHEDQKRNHAPGNLERSGTFALFGTNPGTVTEARGEKNDAHENR